MDVRKQHLKSHVKAVKMGVFIHGKSLLGMEYLRPYIRELSRTNLTRTLWAVAGDWLIIVACFFGALQFHHWPVWFIAAILIATRQHALLVLMHDASHNRFMRNLFWNDFLGNVLCGYPHMVTVEGYRSNHLAHHFYLNTDKDPDSMRKKGHPDWVFPKTKKQLAFLFLKDLLGRGAYDNYKAMRHLTGKKPSEWGVGKRGIPLVYSRALYYLVILSFITLTHLWIPFMLLWVVPLFTFLPMLLRLRSIARHYGLEAKDDLNMSRNYQGNRLEGFFLFPHNIEYHLDHHLLPSVPFFNLPKLHKFLQTLPDYPKRAHQNTSFFGQNGQSVINDICI